MSLYNHSDENKFRLLKKDQMQGKKKEKRINLKDLFSPVDSLEEQTPVRENKSKSRSREKRINFGELKQSMEKFNDDKSVQSQSDNSMTRKPKETRIKMNSLNHFYRNKEME